ncbi:PCRF domain-containing protein [Candidatus Nesciobacter abundans]|uniref:PCRF domain-containing protein n=1 Tax=Candidatus Nesciobacter abundans TaxID=2601668 RepID=A0A5C0UI84_9PROT|nr:PCRF domain-containing protein [Candidatus Nesciobacter abundans]QEK39102.1 PCRF domain-containing protein [Candidatus Nesciobacter abundans]
MNIKSGNISKNTLKILSKIDEAKQNNWWKEIIEEYAFLEKKSEDMFLSGAEKADVYKRMGMIFKELEISKKAELAFDTILQIEELSKFEQEDEFANELRKEQSDLLNDLEKLKTDFSDLKNKTQESDQSIIMEIKPGVGGDEAALFSSLLLSMYANYCTNRKFKFEIINQNITDIGGLKEVIINISGENAFNLLKNESGVHRVQRVPKTESSGRIHTSTSAVSVMQEKENVDIKIDENYLRVDVYRSSGPGGQSVNTTDSAVRLTYSDPDLDTITVCIQDEKSQHKNKEKGMKVLKTRLVDMVERKEQENLASIKKEQIGSADRSEKIRTYNFPQNRITDHRSKVTIHSINDSNLMTFESMEKIIKSLE